MKKRSERKKLCIRICLTVIAVVTALIFIMPIVLTISNSFMSAAEITSNYGSIFQKTDTGGKQYISQTVNLKFIPDMVTFSQYATVLFKSPDYLLKFWNSVILVVPIVVFQLVVAVLAAYGFTRTRGKLSAIVFFAYVILMMMPYQVTLVPNYLVLNWMKLLDTNWSIWLPGIFSPFSVYLITKYMRRIPVPLIEAAKIDGANEFQVFTKICIPICKGVITTCAILVFMDYWNMVEQPLLFFNDTDKYPLSIFLSKINAQEVGLAFAVATFYMIPSLLIFLYGEDQLVEGIAYQGGVKDRKWRVKKMTDRKDKIKNITIIFLLVMLILTFFSNTIMNYSLVEVSTQQVTSGQITSKVRGSGSVEASESYSVTIEETRKIATVNVKKDAEVATGDLLFTLEDTDSDELDAAKKSLNEAQAAYESAVLTAGITVAERQSIEAGKGSSLTQKQNEIAAANQRVKDAQAAVDAAQASVDKIKAQIDAVSNSTADTTAEEKAVLDAEKKNSEAQDSLTSAESAYTPVKSAYDTALSGLQSAQSAYDEAVAEYNAAKKAYNDETDATKKASKKDAMDAAELAMNKAKRQLDTAQSTFNTCQANLNKVQGSYDSAKSAATDSKNALSNANYNLSVKKLTGTNTAEANNLQAQLNTATAALTDANTALTSATNDQKKVTDKISGEVTIASAYKTMTDLQEEVAKLQAKSIGTEITSPISGTVTDIAVTAGTTVNANDVMMTIQPENKAYVLQFSVTENQAKKVRVGDTAEILNNWYGNDVSAVVSAIRKDPQNRTNSIIICEMKGDVSVGDSYTLSIGEQSSNYDTIVPTSAIREDSNGKFILIIESKSTPLGNRYYARRVDVDVITSDDTKSAVTGALEGYEYVITTTTKPIKENEQVRLASE